MELKTKEHIEELQKFLISIADNENIIADGGNIVYRDKFKYKHTFADGIYVREMTIEKDEIIIGAIHKHLHVWFLLSGSISVVTEDGTEEYTAPHYVISTPGTKRIIYAHEESIFVNVHKNPTNTQDIKELEKQIVALSYKEYEEYIKK